MTDQHAGDLAGVQATLDIDFARPGRAWAGISLAGRGEVETDDLPLGTAAGRQQRVNLRLHGKLSAECG
ncbi:hypothetical protein D9M73_226190 [compost metagenome]